MYADDTMVMAVLTNARQWLILEKIYNLYARPSNSRPNYTKSDTIAAGRHGNKPNNLGGIKVLYKRSVRYLGIPVGSHLDYESFWEIIRCR